MWTEAEERRSGDCRALTSESRLAAFRSPIAWFALALLVVNDHVLKGAGVLPGWATGKLSDFAGLVVAPLVVCALLGVRGPGTRLLGFAAVVVPFVAIKTVPAATHWVESVASGVGLRWRLWTDPWDLIGLVVLPLAWRLQTASQQAPRGKRAPTLERIGVIVAAAACLATSNEEDDPSNPTYVTYVAILNMTSEDVGLQVFRPSAPLDCSIVAPDPQAALRATDFSTNECLTLSPHLVVPLALGSTREGEESPDAGPPRPCEAVLLRATGLNDVVLFWDEVELESNGEYAAGPGDPRVAYLDRVGEHLFVSGPSVATVFAPDFALPDTSCGVQP